MRTILISIFAATCMTLPVYAGFVLVHPSPPAEPTVKPRISHLYSNDNNHDKIDDRLTSEFNRIHKEISQTTSPLAQQTLSTSLQKLVEVELVFDRQVTQTQIDEFIAAGGNINFIYTHVSYGWTGKIPLQNIGQLTSRLGKSLVVIEKPLKVELTLDRATQTGRVRHIWADGFADTHGIDGDASITIAIVDTGIDDTHPDLSGRQVYWHDFSGDNNANPIDIPQHGTHVSGIALGTGASGGIDTGTLEYTAIGDLSDTGGFHPSPVDRLSGNTTFALTAQWTGGGDTTLHDVYHTKPGGGWQSFSSVTGSSPLNLSPVSAADLTSAYTPALLGQGDNSVADFVVTCRFSNYPAVGDGFPKFRGVAPECQWAAAKVFDSTGSGNSVGIGQAIDDLVANRIADNIKVMNLSLGTIGTPGISTSLRQKVNTAVNNGIVVCVSAGNDGEEDTDAKREIDDPGRAALALTVAAANDINQLTSYTSQGFTAPGTTAGEEEDYKPDLMAPGGSLGKYTGIMAPDSNSGDGTAFADQQNDDYYNIQGTSMSSPFAAGCAALIIDAMQQSGTAWDFSSSTNALFVKMLLCATATESNSDREDGNNNPTLQRAVAGPDGFPVGKDKYEGFGMINPDAAIEAVLLSYMPGESVTNALGGAPEDRRAWAKNVSIPTGKTFDPKLTVPASGDFDLYLYSSTPSNYGTPVMLASSTSAGAGTDESLNYTPTTDLTGIIVVKLVSGNGTFSLSSSGITPVELTVNSQHGNADPPVGTHTYNYGSSIACSITSTPVVVTDTQSWKSYACTGWVGSGSVPSAGSTTNSGNFTITTNSSITWLWALQDLVLSNQTATATTNYSASHSIKARDRYTVAPGCSVIFNAGSEIRLQPGFHASSGSVFRAHIQENQ